MTARSTTAICVHLAALGPPPSTERYVSAGHARIAAAFGSASGHVVVGVRCERPDGDPLRGWRIPVVYAIGPRSEDEVVAVAQELESHTYVDDAVVQQVASDAGRHRVYHDPDPRTVPERAATLDMKYWELLGLVDRLKLVYALAPDVEIHMSIDRVAGSPRFDDDDVRLLGEILCGLGPWARRIALLHGYLEGQTALSARERDVACALLGREPLKVIAADLGMSEARAREIVRAVYRKLQVGSRAQLASTWAGEHATAPAQPIAIATGRTTWGRRERS